MKIFLTSLIIILLLSSCYYESIHTFFGTYELKKDLEGKIYFHNINGEIDQYFILPPFFPQEEGRIFFIVWRSSGCGDNGEIFWWGNP